MSENKSNAVLENLVNVLQKAIVGTKVQKTSADEYVIVDGNASIIIKQSFEADGKIGAILIVDQKEILYSEELLEQVYKIQADVPIHINGLNIEAELIYYEVRDGFYAQSSSYEFRNFIARNVHQMSFKVNFGDEVTFELQVLNKPDLITVEAVIADSVPAPVKAAINADVQKVSLQINQQFKKDTL